MTRFVYLAAFLAAFVPGRATAPAQEIEAGAAANVIAPKAVSHCWFEQRGMDKFCFTLTTERR